MEHASCEYVVERKPQHELDGPTAVLFWANIWQVSTAGLPDSKPFRWRSELQHLVFQYRPFSHRRLLYVDTKRLWDNRCVLHNPINHYHGYKRLLHRVTLKGDRPF